MFQDLFEANSGLAENHEPPDGTNVNQFIFYYSDEEFQQFKSLLKQAMIKEFPSSFQQANASDTMLHILKKYYANGEVKTTL